MTFQEWWDRQDESLKFIMSKETAQYTWLASRLQTTIEVRDWLESKIKNMPLNPTALAMIKDIHTTMAANVERGGEWSTSIIHE